MLRGDELHKFLNCRISLNANLSGGTRLWNGTLQIIKSFCEYLWVVVFLASFWTHHGFSAPSALFVCTALTELEQTVRGQVETGTELSRDAQQAPLGGKSP